MNKHLTLNLKPSLVFKGGYSSRFVGGVMRFLVVAISACGLLMVGYQTTV